MIEVAPRLTVVGEAKSEMELGLGVGVGVGAVLETVIVVEPLLPAESVIIMVTAVPGAIIDEDGAVYTKTPGTLVTETVPADAVAET